MNACIKTRRLIDQADLPDALPFEVGRHIESCGDCRNFAAERARLRELLSSGARVTAPAGFDAMLRERLEARTSRRRLAWLSPAGYLRVGAATAALLVAVVAGQQFFAGRSVSAPGNDAPPNRDLNALHSADSAEPASGALILDPSATTDTTHEIAENSGPGRQQPRRSSRGQRRGEPIYLPDALGYDNVGVRVLVVGKNGERELRVPAVSAGAQLPFYVNSGRPQPQARPVHTSF